MVLPIVALGHPILKQVATEIDQSYTNYRELIDNMYETMYKDDGVGLAAPQINLSIRLFVIDADPFKDTYPEAEGFKKVFINPTIIEEAGKEWFFNEGCLSVPDIHEDVLRKERVLLRYYDEDFNKKEEWFEGVCARVIQHEYDHLEGKVFTDRVGAMTRLLLKKKLEKIRTGDINMPYKMIFCKKSR
ncbi:MAG: peptide deformylase [Bacteroidales bacterium]|jgi:peptide deformylase|nr:peptide deformylase [Bacteroidales bacterium]MDD2205278.1 peptide deformylase [Bacteroidales bacterium]MDD3151272.1 peptide deformylase [Bacteroidales bacterium]MDD3914245.1 peptide deformylase [Bacteroidales bacterium]MDD4633439.1 peptide deformylase [Bacteroidales bacterium]